jgi:regulation of enolase protein 1 (concanavalin A-like superfamily)
VSHRVAIESLPFPLSWQPEPVEFRTGPDWLWARAGDKTDLFVDPGTRFEHLNAPRLVGPVVGNFTLAARVNVDLRSTFDAGVLLLWAHEHAWAKLCFELSPEGAPTIVSVVTRGPSDDCNSFATERDGVWLRIALLGTACAFHVSTDRRRWELIRYFPVDADADLLVGFLVQSPRGPGCAARFEEISFAPTALADIRSGD